MAENDINPDLSMWPAYNKKRNYRKGVRDAACIAEKFGDPEIRDAILGLLNETSSKGN